MASRLRFAALLAILVLAASLRFAGLASGLRHTPFIDEQFFVMNVEGMLERGDLDHRFHMYPGFFFYLLTPALAVMDRPFGADAYLAARSVVAALGVATVALVYVLGARLGSPRAGLIGALVLAVSPVAVFVAHEVRPDVALGLFAMIGLLLIARVDGRFRGDVLGGIAVGMATAIKFTGVALALPYLARRWPFKENRWRGMLLAGAVSIAAYGVLSPYSFLHFGDFLEGVLLQKSYRDEIRGRGPQDFGDVGLVYVTHVLPRSLGLPALLAAIAGLWVRRRDWRDVAPLALLPVALIALLSTAQIQRSRYFLAALGAMAVLAGFGVDAAWRRSRALGIVLVLIVVAVPLNTTVRDVAAFQRPSTLDRVLDWSIANIAEGRRMATTHPQIGLDRARFEVVSMDGWGPSGRRAAGFADVVIAAVAADREPLPGFSRRFVAHPAHPLEGPPMEVLVREEDSTATVPVDLRHARLRASEGEERLTSIVDGDLGTRWETRETQQAGMWVEVGLETPQLIDRVELAMGGRPNQWGRHLAVEISEDGREWARVETNPGRAMVPDQVAGEGGRAQVLLLTEARVASALRLVLVDSGQPRWGFAEIAIHARTNNPRQPPAARKPGAAERPGG